jgi:hypothetical protein
VKNRDYLLIVLLIKNGYVIIEVYAEEEETIRQVEEKRLQSPLINSALTCYGSFIL